MKLTCTQENLSKALSLLERIVGKQTTLPILSNILLETEKGRLRLSATNLEIGVIASIGAKIEEEGKIAIPAKFFGNFIHNLPLGEILSLTTEQTTLTIKSGQYKGSLRGLDGKDFPIIPQYQQAHYPLQIKATALREALVRLLPSVGQNETRPELTGVNVLFQENILILAATDSFRLGEYCIELTEVPKEYVGVSVIIPQSTLQEVLRVLQTDTQVVQCAFEENQVFFDIEGVSIVSRLIHGKFPDYQQIIPTSFRYSISFDREEFLRALKVTSVLSQYTSGEITLHFESGKEICVVSALSREVGENRAEVTIGERVEDDVTLIFNPRYLIEGLNSLQTAKFSFKMNSSTTPVSITESHTNTPKNKYFYIIMPIRH